MKIHQVVFREVDRDKFDEIAKQTKTIETRAATSKYRSIKAGDELKFICGENEIVKTVRAIKYFSSLDMMLNALPIGKILPSAHSTEEAKNIYYSFPGYREEIEANGILAFYLH